MSQVNRKGEKPASSPALDAELRRRANSYGVRTSSTNETATRGASGAPLGSVV